MAATEAIFRVLVSDYRRLDVMGIAKMPELSGDQLTNKLDPILLVDV